MLLTQPEATTGKALVRIHLSHISVERRFEATPERAWDLLTDTTKWRYWGPSVRRVACSERYIRMGSQGEVFTPIGIRVRFLITEYTHGYYWAWKVAGIQATGHRLIPLGTTACTIAFEIPAYCLAYAVICNIALKKMDRILRLS
jgi:hypothetical protein